MESIKWGEFDYKKLFKPVVIKNKLVKSNLNSSGETPVYSSESTNNGIVGYTDKTPDFIINEENPIYIVFGDHTRSFNIATSDFCVMDNVKVLSVREKYSIKSLLFIVSAWKRCIPNLGYSRHWSKAKNSLFNLPIKEDGKIDFTFIESFMENIEEENFKTIRDYLQTKGLKIANA
ncbi:MAG: restriction endonuclease subunit S [Candidatus Kapaibacterium sp.]